MRVITNVWKLVLAVIALAVPLGASPANAAKVVATPGATDTLIVSGPWSKKTDWSAEHPPAVTELAVIPAGKEVTVSKSATSGPIQDYGHIGGFQTLTVFGAVYLAPGSFDLNGTLDLEGMGTLTAEDTIYYLRIDGNETLAAPLHAGVITAYRGSTLATNGYPVTVDTETYPFEEADWLLGSSTYTTGWWLVFEAAQGGEIHAEHASIIVTGLGGNLLGGGLFKGEHWTYGKVTFQTPEGQSRDSYNVAGTLTINGGTSMERGRTVGIGGLASEGTIAAPGTLTSSEPGVTYTLKIPHDETVEGCMVIEDAVVEGGTLTVPCGTGARDTGVVFATE